MAEYTVLAEISCAKISKELSLDKACLFGCGVSTGLGAVWNTCKVEVDSSVAVFGLGAVGLAVIQGAKMAGASRIIAVDINPTKFKDAIALGATDTVDSSKLDEPVQSHIVEMTKWGADVSWFFSSNFVEHYFTTLLSESKCLNTTHHMCFYYHVLVHFRLHRKYSCDAGCTLSK